MRIFTSALVGRFRIGIGVPIGQGGPSYEMTPEQGLNRLGYALIALACILIVARYG